MPFMEGASLVLALCFRKFRVRLHSSAVYIQLLKFKLFKGYWADSVVKVYDACGADRDTSHRYLLPEVSAFAFADGDINR
jgi:hypothetical protein